LVRFKPVEGRANQCVLHLVQHFDFAGYVPVFILNSKLPAVLEVASEIRERFEKDDEVDQTDRDELARVIGEEEQVYTAEELTLIKKVHVQLEMLEWKNFEELDSPDHLVKMGKIFVDGSSSCVARASVTVDASVEECAAWEMAAMSRERVKNAGSLERSLTRINEHHCVVRVVHDFKVPGFQPREFLTAQVWQQQGDKLSVAYDDDEHEDFPRIPSLVRGLTNIHYEFKKLPPVGSLPQTRVTYTQQVDPGGAIPKFVVNGQVVYYLMYLSAMRKRFDKSLDIDGGARMRNVEMIKGHDVEFSAEETKLLESGEKQFAMFNGMKAKALKMASPLATAKIAFKSGDRHAWGWATTTVRASPEEVLAYTWDPMRRSASREDDVEKSVDERKNDHNLLLYYYKKMPKIVADRDFLSRVVWRKYDGGKFILVTSPTESGLRPQNSSAVRATYPSTMKFSRKGESETTVEYVIHPDVGGDVPSFLMNNYTARNLGSVTAIQEYFQALRKLEEWDEDDGRVVGEVLCIKTTAEKRRETGESKVGARLRGLFERLKGLKQIAEKYEFFQLMMTRVVENKLRPTVVVNTPLCDVSKREGIVMARGLAMAMASNLTAEAAVDQWVLQYRALRELDKEEAWFRPMMNVVGKRLLGEVSWGLKMRVMMGAGLSVMDMATDIFVIVGYMEKEETKGYGWSLLGMIVGSMVIQLLCVFLQNRKTPLKMLGEMLIVLTGLKPGFDAFNVCSGKEADEHSVFDAKTELVICKGIEMVCESIPGCVLQLFAILKNKDRTRRAIVSVAVSALTTGFNSASISFDADVDPQKRKEVPDYYGYIPDDGKRTVIFGCMVVNSSLLLLVRSLSAAMLMLAQKRYFVLYMAGDMGVYLLQKMLRGDFHYWVPIGGAFGLFCSLLVRVLCKAIADFTGVIHCRHPYELGGLYWTGNMMLALLASFASVWIYFESGGEDVTKREAWTLVGYMGGGWVMSFVLFLLLMKKEYRSTFFSTTSGKQHSMNYFLKGGDDEVKSAVLACNMQHWRQIRGEVKTWVLNNWYRWVEEKPLWFTEAWLAKVPNDFIPEDEDQAMLEEIRKKKRRRSSAAEALDPARIHPIF